VNDHGTPRDDRAKRADQAQDLVNQLNLLEAVDRRLTPEHVARRFGELLDDTGYGDPPPGHMPVTEVPPGTIGVVFARVGAVAPPSQTLCQSADCDSFQDEQAFLRNGGQMGRQADILTAGAYRINPEAFEVLTVDTVGNGKYGLTAADLKEVVVPVGHAGVVIAMAGAEPGDADDAVGPKIEGHANFQLASAFLGNGGQRGVQSQTLSPGGVYQVNPWFARVVLVPTREILLQWSPKRDKPDGSYDAALDEIMINIEGYRLRLTPSQALRIPAHAAPRLIARFGEQEEAAWSASRVAGRAPVQRFAERVLGGTVTGYILSVATRRGIIEFLASYGEIQHELHDTVVMKLAEWGVEAVSTTLGEPVPETGDLDEIRRAVAAERAITAQLEHQLINARIKADTLQVTAAAEAQAGIAEQMRLLEREIQLLGTDHVATERLIAQFTQMAVPSTIVSSGNDDAAKAILEAMPFAQARDMLLALARESGKDRPPGQQAIESIEDDETTSSGH
jgi:hypothetical protein